MAKKIKRRRRRAARNTKFVSVRIVEVGRIAAIKRLAAEDSWCPISQDAKDSINALIADWERKEMVVEAARDACLALACTEYEDAPAHRTLHKALADHDQGR
jgi:hypothetical protein